MDVTFYKILLVEILKLMTLATSNLICMVNTVNWNVPVDFNTTYY